VSSDPNPTRESFTGLLVAYAVYSLDYFNGVVSDKRDDSTFVLNMTQIELVLR